MRVVNAVLIVRIELSGIPQDSLTDTVAKNKPGCRRGTLHGLRRLIGKRPSFHRGGRALIRGIGLRFDEGFLLLIRIENPFGIGVFRRVVWFVQFKAPLE